MKEFSEDGRRTVSAIDQTEASRRLYLPLTAPKSDALDVARAGEIWHIRSAHSGSSSGYQETRLRQRVHVTAV